MEVPLHLLTERSFQLLLVSLESNILLLHPLLICWCSNSLQQLEVSLNNSNFQVNINLSSSLVTKEISSKHS